LQLLQQFSSFSSSLLQVVAAPSANRRAKVWMFHDKRPASAVRLMCALSYSILASIIDFCCFHSLHHGHFHDYLKKQLIRVIFLSFLDCKIIPAIFSTSSKL
jgi:hypothetical protein